MLDVSSSYSFSPVKRLRLALLSGMMALGIFAVDLYFPRGVAVGLLYITVVLISLRSPLPQDTIYAASLGSVLAVVDYALSAPAVPAAISLTNRAIYLATIWTTAVICLKQKRAERERQELHRIVLEVNEREQKHSAALSLTKVLSNLLNLGIFAKGLKDGSPADSTDKTSEIDKVVRHINQAVEHARQLSEGLGSISLNSSDLASALKHLTSNAGATLSVKCEFKCATSHTTFEPNVVVHLYRVVQIALRNAIEHRKATEVVVTLEQTAGRHRLEINDNGLGLDGMSKEGSDLLQIMGYRAGLIGASLEIKQKPEGGALVTCSIPITRDRNQKVKL